MRRRDAKVGKAVHHDKTNRHLGTILSLGSNVVVIRADGGTHKEIAAYGEIVRCDCLERGA